MGPARKSIEKAFNRGVDKAWKFNVPDFSLYIQETPQTTTGCDYPDSSIEETCSKIGDNIKQNFSDFDTAIFGCGAYGPPLMNILSEMPGKNLMYLGSGCYTMFGIYSHGMPIPNDSDIESANWIEVEEKVTDNLKNIDAGKYWKF